jgi:hypothetical protein
MTTNFKKMLGEKLENRIIYAFLFHKMITDFFVLYFLDLRNVR